MSISEDFYLKRRSVLAKKMSPKPIKKGDLNQIIQAGIRVPDHGALNPWKLVIIQGEQLAKIDKDSKNILKKILTRINIFMRLSQKDFKEQGL